MSEEVKDQAAEVETTECSCGCGCQDAAPVAKKSNLTRIIVWVVVAILAIGVVSFRGKIVERLQRGKNIAMINEDAEKDLGYKPFKIEALGDYKFKVTLKESPKDNLKNFNVVNFEVNKDGVLDLVSEQDRTNWINMSEKKQQKSQPAAEAKKPAEAAK